MQRFLLIIANAVYLQGNKNLKIGACGFGKSMANDIVKQDKNLSQGGHTQPWSKKCKINEPAWVLCVVIEYDTITQMWLLRFGRIIVRLVENRPVR